MFYKFYDRGSTTAPGVMGPATLFLQGLYKKKKYILVSVARRKTPKRPKRADKKWRYLPFPFIHMYIFTLWNEGSLTPKTCLSSHRNIVKVLVMVLPESVPMEYSFVYGQGRKSSQLKLSIWNIHIYLYNIFTWWILLPSRVEQIADSLWRPRLKFSRNTVSWTDCFN